MEHVERAFASSRLSEDLIAAAYEKLVPIPRARLPARRSRRVADGAGTETMQVRRRA